MPAWYAKPVRAAERTPSPGATHDRPERAHRRLRNRPPGRPARGHRPGRVRWEPDRARRQRRGGAGAGTARPGRRGGDGPVARRARLQLRRRARAGEQRATWRGSGSIPPASSSPARTSVQRAACSRSVSSGRSSAGDDQERAMAAALSCYNTGDLARGLRNGYVEPPVRAAAALAGRAVQSDGRALTEPGSRADAPRAVSQRAGAVRRGQRIVDTQPGDEVFAWPWRRRSRDARGASRRHDGPDPHAARGQQRRPWPPRPSTRGATNTAESTRTSLDASARRGLATRGRSGGPGATASGRAS